MVTATIQSETSSSLSQVGITDELAWDVYGCWKEQLFDRFGGGTPSPSIPNSQRQYDGDNHFEFCEIWVS